MSLDWRLGNIENYEKLCWIDDGMGNEDLNPDTYALIWATIGTGIGDLKESNVNEFIARLRIMEKLWGVTYPSNDVIRAHIGLWTNVFPQESRSAWLKRIVGGQMKDIIWDLKKENV